MPGEYQPFSGLPRSTLSPHTQQTRRLSPPPLRRPTHSIRRTPSSRNSTVEIELPPRRRHRSTRNIITIPFPPRPTLFLRPPRRILEIERVRCRRRHHYVSEPQILATNPITVSIPSSSSPPQQRPTLTTAMIESLPKRIVHFPSIHLGENGLSSQGLLSQNEADLDIVTLPAEYIGPDGTLSILQLHPPMQQIQTSMLNMPQMNVTLSPESNLAPFLNTGNMGTLAPENQNSIASGSEIQQFLQQTRQLFQRLGPVASVQQLSLIPSNTNPYSALSQNHPSTFSGTSDSNPLFTPPVNLYNPMSVPLFSSHPASAERSFLRLNGPYGVQRPPSYSTSGDNQGVSSANLTNPVLSGTDTSDRYQSVRNNTAQSILQPTNIPALTNATYSRLQPPSILPNVSHVPKSSTRENKNMSRISNANRQIVKKYVQITAK
ncbi:unnamed protein product [Didymodactylos carnosus]|uniref:Uncharacterized protein n=1 Tax=Didymodactylos carnosus TaxID=1234261 RepID=A0A815DGA9_9BILA|nr:unnamed protein product [Didymodactylos carnosus]CAF1296657.1 unnamed protein product [Didymodactylos carnosus]CAF3707666.1 unnamed protein product [Didymodactylos carnosus]CAF4112217.1 unnamed protein product [Didymodactylos carnosus]